MAQDFVSYSRRANRRILGVCNCWRNKEDGTKDERIAAGVQLLADNLEQKIRLKPEDWHLFVPNWPSDREESP